MRTYVVAVALPLTLLATCALAAPPPSPAAQIAAAVLPAPPELRDSATVRGYDETGRLVVLRAGDGELTCLADDPGDERFHVACYHAGLEPFMARGRELRAAGKGREEVQTQREEEIAAGELTMPPGPSALYSLTGPADAYDPDTHQITGARRVFVIYIPYATEASTGLSAQQMTPGAPWIMSAGKPWAHVMVVQAPEEP